MKDLDLAIRITARDNTGATLARARSGIESISRQLEAARNAALSFAGALVSDAGISGLVRLADELKLVNARLKLAVSGAQEFARAQQFASDVGARTGAGYQAVATLYTRLAQAGQSFGLSQEKIARVTEATALALRISGASAAESAAVIRQFSQALGSGVLRGDEFNTIIENGARLAQALADGVGKPVGELRKLAEQGVLTTDIIALALVPQLDKLRKEADALPPTVGAASVKIRDAFTK